MPITWTIHQGIEIHPERLGTIQKLVETILETLRGGDIEKEVEDSGEFCAKVYRVLAGIDLSLEDAKNSVHVGTSPKLHSR